MLSLYQVDGSNQEDDLPHAILLHTWDKDEVDLQNLDHGLQLRDSEKIVGCCKRANNDGFDYAVSSDRVLSELYISKR